MTTGWGATYPAKLIANKALGTRVEPVWLELKSRFRHKTLIEIPGSSYWHTYAMAAANVLSSMAMWMTTRRRCAFVPFFSGGQPSTPDGGLGKPHRKLKRPSRLLPTGISPKISLIS